MEKIAYVMLIGIVLTAGASVAVQATDAEYICPPCGCGADGQTHTAPGRCSACGMALIPREEVQTVAILLYEGVQIIDYTGPYEVFGQAGFEVHTVTSAGQSITTAMGMKVTPSHGFGSSPRAAILLIPGGNAGNAFADPNTVAWVQQAAGKASHVLSVCNGAFILARAGLLDGLRATTFYGLMDELRSFAPKTQIVPDQRFVDNGKIVTAAGLSSGIDGALHLVSKIRGRGEAERVALNLEYAWDPDSGFARGALAERLVPRLRQPEGTTVDLLGTRGDRDRWETRYRVRTSMPASDLMRNIESQLEARAGWSRAGAGGPGRAESVWSFADEKGAAWTSVALVEGPRETAGLLVPLKVERAGGSPPSR